MPVYNDPFRRRGMQFRPSGSPGEEIQRLVQAYQALQARAEQQTQLLEAKQRELESKQRELATQSELLADVRRDLEIKDEMLRRQGADLKQAEAELVWARAGLQQQ